MSRLMRPSQRWLSYAELGDLIKETKDGAYKTRLIAIRMLMCPHKTQKEVSEELVVSRRTLQRWVARWNEEGPEGLKDRRRGNGRKPILREQVAKELEQLELEIEKTEEVKFLRKGQRVTAIAIYGRLRKKKDKD